MVKITLRPGDDRLGCPKDGRLVWPRLNVYGQPYDKPAAKYFMWPSGHVVVFPAGHTADVELELKLEAKSDKDSPGGKAKGRRKSKPKEDKVSDETKIGLDTDSADKYHG